MSQEDRGSNAKLPGVQPISGPSGLDIKPEPESPRRVSRRAAMLIGGIVILIFLAFAYGGYKRSAEAQTAAASKGMLKGVVPATAAGAEFTKAIPAGNAAVTRAQVPPEQLTPPNESSSPNLGACGIDPNTHQPYRFDPMTGRPCAGPVAAVERVAIRRAPPAQPVQSPPTPHEPTPEERRRQELNRMEHEALIAPTSVRTGGSSAAPLAATRQNDLAQIAALGAALTRPGRSNSGEPSTADLARALMGSTRTAGSAAPADDFDQNMQTRKEQFLEAAASKKGEGYLKSTRTAPLSAYEIKAGWEIPAILEQGLNSDLPGELKALVSSNVYDTATGQFLLIPQGSRLVGRYDSRVAYGQTGVQVVWNRIIFPDASSVDLDGMVGLDAQGNAGLRSKVDRHYSRILGFAALTSLLSAAFEVSQRRNQSILVNPSAGDTASATVGREMSQTGAMITRRNMNVQPTIRVPAGYQFTVRVNRDMLFEDAYEPMTADPQILSPQKELRRRAAAQ